MLGAMGVAHRKNHGLLPVAEHFVFYEALCVSLQANSTVQWTYIKIHGCKYTYKKFVFVMDNFVNMNFTLGCGCAVYMI